MARSPVPWKGWHRNWGSSSRLTISGRPGHRTVFASSAGLNHTLATELSSITFASNADLIQRWINVLQFKIDRDWIWDGLAEAGVRDLARRETAEEGRPRRARRDHPTVPRRYPFAATADVPANVRALQRQFTDVFFFDAFDPKPAPGDFRRKSRSNTGSCRRSKGLYPRPRLTRCPNCWCRSRPGPRKHLSSSRRESRLSQVCAG